MLKAFLLLNSLGVQGQKKIIIGNPYYPCYSEPKDLTPRPVGAARQGERGCATCEKKL